MTVVARVSVDAEAVEIGSALAALPGVSVELERVIPADPDAVPFFWVEGADAEAVEAALSASDAVSDAEYVDRVGDTLLYRCRCRRRRDGVIAGAVESGLTLLSATSENGRWTLDVRGDGWASLRAFRDFCEANGIEMTLESLSPLSETDADERDGLTAPQAEALLAALDAGYYDTPRRATLTDVAERLGITRQALAERLRRGTRHLVADVVRAERSAGK